jgi:hypothetical protein
MNCDGWVLPRVGTDDHRVPVAILTPALLRVDTRAFGVDAAKTEDWRRHLDD